MTSLRTRLALATLAVALAAVAVVALGSRLAVRSEYRRLEADVRLEHLQEVARGLAGVPRETLGAALPSRAKAGSALVLLDPARHVVASSSATLGAARFEADGERLTIEMERTVGGRREARRIVLLGGPQIGVPGTDVQLLELPDPDAEPDEARPDFVAALDRRLLLAAGASSLLALALAWLLAHQILRPIDALTAAARRLGTGDRTAAVEARGAAEIVALGQAFNAMAASVARAEDERRALVADVAHELRTPLTNLRCQVEALQDGLQPVDGPALQSLHEETMLLARLVDDLQQLALGESGRLSIDAQPTDVAALVRAAAAAQASVAPGVAVRVDAAPLAMSVDRERLGQVLRNLLSNALTHTPAGGTVAVTLRREDPWVELLVEDTGPGIPPEHRARVFERFHRVDPSRARATGGAGLGLAIVKQIVLAHGGEVAADAAPGGGARLVVRLPSRLLQEPGVSPSERR